MGMVGMGLVAGLARPHAKPEEIVHHVPINIALYKGCSINFTFKSENEGKWLVKELILIEEGRDDTKDRGAAKLE